MPSSVSIVCGRPPIASQPNFNYNPDLWPYKLKTGKTNRAHNTLTPILFLCFLVLEIM